MPDVDETLGPSIYPTNIYRVSGAVLRAGESAVNETDAGGHQETRRNRY